MIFEDKILFGKISRQIRHTNDRLVIGWNRCQDFKRMHLAEWWVPGKTMGAFMSFSLALDGLCVVRQMIGKSF